MPRETIVVDNFSGGLANSPHARDLDRGELPVAVNLDLRSEGILKPLGIFYPDTSVGWASLITIVDIYEPGYGAFFFSADRDPSGNALERDYYVVAGKSNFLGAGQKVYQVFSSTGLISSTGGNAYDTLAIGDSNPFYPSFYYADGALRVSDGNFSSTKPSTRWMGFIDRTHFAGTGASEVYLDWFFRDQEISPPAEGIAISYLSASASSDSNTFIASTVGGQDYSHWAYDLYDSDIVGHFILRAGGEVRTVTGYNSSVSFETSPISGGWTTGGAYDLYPPAGGVNLRVEAFSSTEPLSNGGTGSLPAGDYYFASSFVYDDNQESPLYRMKGRIDISTATAGTAPYYLGVRPQLTKPFSPRIRAVNVYYGRKDTELFGGANDTEVSIRDWIRLLEIPLESGIKFNTGWTLESVNSTGSVSSDIFLRGKYTIIMSDGSDLYESLSGRSSTEVESKISFKTAIIANRRAYIGNVKLNGKIYGDAIFKSAVNRFDTFSPSDRLEVIAADGDYIVKLEEYADRILAFKRKKVYIINISQNVEFIEEQLDSIGVAAPHHVIRTEYGIVWFNKFGVYMYDGQRVRDLLLDARNASRRKISKEDWESFFDEDKSVAIYDANLKMVFITDDNGSISVPLGINGRAYSIVDLNWTEAPSLFTGSDDTTLSELTITNSIIDNDGNGMVFRSSSSSAKGVRYQLKSPSGFTVETKEYDMGLPGVDKHLYVIYVVHKGATANSVRVQYRKDGTSNLYSTTPLYLPASTTYIVTRMVPAASTDGRNFDSISLRLSVAGSPSTNLEISSMGMIVRRKGLR